MKTPADIRKELSVVESQLADLQKTIIFKTNQHKEKTRKDISMLDSLSKKIERFKFYIHYLESNPTEEFINKEIKRLEGKINLLVGSYKPIDSKNYFEQQGIGGTGLDLENITDKEFESKQKDHRREFEKEAGLPKLRKQLSGLRYILK